MKLSLLCLVCVSLVLSASALDLQHQKNKKANANKGVNDQTVVRVHIRQAPDPQFPVRPPASPPQPPARLHPSIRLEPYAGGAVTQAAPLQLSVMADGNCGTAGQLPCAASSPVTFPTPSTPNTQPQYPAVGAVSPGTPQVISYAQTVPGAPLSTFGPPTPFSSNPVPMPVEVQASQMTQPVTPNIGWEGDRRVGVYSIETSPNVRIIGEDACGCPADVNPCDNPCAKSETPRDRIENKLDAIKSQIVEDAEKVKDQRLWIKQVREVIRHYERKIAQVQKDNSGVQSEIKRLFALKKHYEDLLLQYELDQTHFKKVEDLHAPDEIVVTTVHRHLPPNTQTNCVEADACP